MELYERVNYLIEDKYIISSYIREYDISKANINILYYYKKINKSTYLYLYKSDRMTRQITIGNMIKADRSIYNTISSGIVEFKKKFFLSNDIQFDNVLSIKNDAIFLINKIPQCTKFDNIEFKLKNTYSSFYKIFQYELYYIYNRIHNTEKFSIKGINDIVIKRHEKYFIDFLKTIFCEIELQNFNEAANMIKIFYNDFINNKLDINYYREFNHNSEFKLNMGFKYNPEYYTLPEVNKRYYKYIDKSYNAKFLLELYKIIVNICFRNNKKS